MKYFLLTMLAISVTALAGCDSSNATPPVTKTSSNVAGKAEQSPTKNSTSSGNSATDVKTPVASDPAAPASTSNGTTQPAAKSTEVHQISFDDLNCSMQADIQFRPWMLTDRVKELDGKRVRIAGYMNPTDKQKGITEFILLRNTECKFGPSGQADHLIQVKLNKGVTASYSIGPLEVVGTLVVNPYTGPDGNTWSIFDMTGESAKPLRR
jgi:hypothetical protein